MRKTEKLLCAVIRNTVDLNPFGFKRSRSVSGFSQKDFVEIF